MLEADVIHWLSKRLKGTAEVYHNKPDRVSSDGTRKNKNKSKFVTVERIAGNVENRLDRADLLIQTWAVSSYEASELAYKIRNILLTEDSPSNIYNIQIDNLYENRDPDGFYGRYAISVHIIATLGVE